MTLVRAELEPEMAADPLLPEVCWSWLTGALEARGLAYGEASGTVTMAGSHYFGGLADRRPATQIEIRASWTPREGLAGVPDTGRTWRPGATCSARSRAAARAGRARGGGDGRGVVSLPQRRGRSRSEGRVSAGRAREDEPGRVASAPGGRARTGPRPPRPRQDGSAPVRVGPGRRSGASHKAFGKRPGPPPGG